MYWRLEELTREDGAGHAAGDEERLAPIVVGHVDALFDLVLENRIEDVWCKN